MQLLDNEVKQKSWKAKKTYKFKDRPLEYLSQLESKACD